MRSFFCSVYSKCPSKFKVCWLSHSKLFVEQATYHQVTTNRLVHTHTRTFSRDLLSHVIIRLNNATRTMHSILCYFIWFRLACACVFWKALRCLENTSTKHTDLNKNKNKNASVYFIFTNSIFSLEFCKLSTKLDTDFMFTTV